MAEQKFDPETGEVIEDGIETVTIKHGDREIHTTSEGLENAADQAKRNHIIQEQLFETHPIEQIVTNMKAACISEVDVETGKTRVPKLDEQGFFLVRATIGKVNHKRDKDFVLIRTVEFNPREIHEVDEITAKRFLRQTDR